MNKLGNTVFSIFLDIPTSFAIAHFGRDDKFSNFISQQVYCKKIRNLFYLFDNHK